MALTARGPDLTEIVGSFASNIGASGIAGGSGTTTTVTIPQFATCFGAIVSGATSTTAVYVDTVSGNTFTATHASNDLFCYLALGTMRT